MKLMSDEEKKKQKTMYVNCANWCKCESPAEVLVLKIERYAERLTQGYSE